MHPFGRIVVSAGKVGAHWFGQSSWAFRAPDGATVLVDPYFPHDRPAEKFIHAEPPVREADLKTDAVVLTHDHSDHTHPETLARIRAAWPKAVFIGPAESAARLDKAGVAREPFVTVRAGEEAAASAFTAHFVWAKPPQGDPKAGIRPPDVTHLGVVLAVGARRLYVSGDCLHTFADLDELVGPVRALGPQIGFLTCHPTEGEFPFFDGCARMAQRIGLRVAVPAHYECFVKRTYDPAEWARAFLGSGVATRVFGYNQSAVL